MEWSLPRTIAVSTLQSVTVIQRRADQLLRVNIEMRRSESELRPSETEMRSVERLLRSAETLLRP
jgi:hypothetical protein